MHGLIFQFRFLILKCMTTIKSHGASKPKTSLWKKCASIFFKLRMECEFCCSRNPPWKLTCCQKDKDPFFLRDRFLFPTTNDPFCQVQMTHKMSFWSYFSTTMISKTMFSLRTIWLTTSKTFLPLLINWLTKIMDHSRERRQNAAAVQCTIKLLYIT